MSHSKQKRTSSLPKLPLPPETRDLPATQGMLQLVRTELKEDISGLRSEMKSGFSNVDKRFDEVRAMIHDLSATVHSLSASVHRVEASAHKVSADVAHQSMLAEEQNSRNLIVLEGLTGLGQRQTRVELRMDETWELVRSYAAMARKP